jgi:hypothetical protein
MPTYVFLSDDGSVVEVEMRVKDMVDFIEVEGVKYKRIFTPNTNMFVPERMSAADDNFSYLKHLDQQPNRMILKDGKVTGKTTLELEAERILVPLKES